MKNLPIGIQTFEKLIEDNYVYVDKTAYIHKLITAGSYYFLSRPRRFGKSLLVSTLEAIFLGKRELFVGLAIDSLEYEWKKHPVISISFSDIPSTTPEMLENGIKNRLHRLALKHNISLDKDTPSGEMLSVLVEELSQINRVVLLIDEYDYSILRHIHNPEMADKIRETLRIFYDSIKGLDRYLKFVFLTGVTQFSKTSIFSGLNNLEDISVSNEYNGLLGYTRDEIIRYLPDRLANVCGEINYSQEQLLHKITVWYDGYRFCQSNNADHMYNPFSVLLCLKNAKFENYWFQTGTPTFLINLLKTRNYPIQDLENSDTIDSELKQFDINTLELKTLMFQTGYLTIKEYNPTTHIYRLGYPNKETIDALGYLTVNSMTGLEPAGVYNAVASLRDIFRNNKLDELYAFLTTLFASVPYTIHIGKEKYYQTIFYIVLKMLGADIIVEKATNIGRIDAVLKISDYIYVIEFKINKTAAEALDQIKEKKYYQPYVHDGKNIILVGIAFDTAAKNVSEVVYRDFL